MDSRSQAPHKSSSFSSATTRDDGRSRSREVDRNLSLGALRNAGDNRDKNHGAAQREQSIKEEDEGEAEEGDGAGDDLSALSTEIEKFIAGDAPVTDATLENFADAVERAIARSEGGGDKLAAHGALLAALSSALGKSPAEGHTAAAAQRVAAVTQRVMALLEDEFHALLEGPPRAADHDHDGDRCVLPSAAAADAGGGGGEPYPAETVARLRAIADAMAAGGRAAECAQVFLVARRNAFDAALRALGYDNTKCCGADDVARMAWEPLEAAAAGWIKAFRHATNVGLSTEHDLCTRVFAGARAAAVFADLARCVLLHMLGFTEGVAQSRRATEKLFKVLDMYEAVRDAGPVVDAFLLSDHASAAALAELKSEIAAARARLCESVAAIFRELESSIRADAAKQPVPGGAVHPLTRYVMNYVKFACAYNSTLEQVFREQQDQSPSSADDDTQNQNPFAAQLVEVMELLHSNLEAKSRLYKDPSLSSIFLMNNGRYTLQKIRGSAEVNAMLGESWARKQSSGLRQYHKNYQRETWSRVLGMLRDDGVITVKGHVQKPVLKERFKQFNAAMDEIHRTQGAWVVSDEQLQSELRVSIAAVVVPAYRSFLGRFAQNFTAGRQTEKYVKLSAEDVETIIDELFDGNATSMTRRR